MQVLVLGPSQCPQPADVAVTDATTNATPGTFADEVVSALVQLLVVCVKDAKPVRMSAADFESFFTFARKYGSKDATAAREKAA
jgi:hypothetical protein